MNVGAWIWNTKESLSKLCENIDDPGSARDEYEEFLDTIESLADAAERQSSFENRLLRSQNQQLEDKVKELQEKFQQPQKSRWDTDLNNAPYGEYVLLSGGEPDDRWYAAGRYIGIVGNFVDYEGNKIDHVDCWKRID